MNDKFSYSYEVKDVKRAVVIDVAVSENRHTKDSKLTDYSVGDINFAVVVEIAFKHLRNVVERSCRGCCGCCC